MLKHLLKILVICAVGGIQIAVGQVMTFPSPAGLDPAPDFTVEVNGVEQFVYDSPVAPFALFAFKGKVSVRIKASQDAHLGVRQSYTAWNRNIQAVPLRGDIKKLVVRPLQAGISTKVEGNTISFTLNKPCQLSIEINDNLTRPLWIFADAENPDLPQPNDPGIRYFAPGLVHKVGEVQLHDNETVYIPGGAVVVGWIRGEGVKNARVIGQGILDGSNHQKVKSQLISLMECHNILFDGLVVLNELGWTIVPRKSEQITFRNIKLLGWGNNSDGIDISGCSNITVDRCFLRNNDDCITIKATIRNQNNDVDGVTVKRSVFWNSRGGNAMEIGFELRTNSIRNVLWQDCDVIHVEDGAVFSIHNGDWATVENVCYENIRVEDARDELIDLCVGLSIYSDDCPFEFSRSNAKRQSITEAMMAQPTTNNKGVWLRLPEAEMAVRSKNRGQIKNIIFKDIRVSGDNFPTSIIQGYNDERPIENVTLQGLTIQGLPIINAKQGNFFIERAVNVRFKGTKAK
ncbi:MAG: glycosyl hydrolase family 28 protein [Prolixibacteraceae bacterium]|jgi:hypothetical protein